MKKISVNYSRTINLGNYESMKVECGMEDTLEENESFTNKYGKMWMWVKDEVQRQIDAKCGRR